MADAALHRTAMTVGFVILSAEPVTGGCSRTNAGTSGSSVRGAHCSSRCTSCSRSGSATGGTRWRSGRRSRPGNAPRDDRSTNGSTARREVPLRRPPTTGRAPRASQVEVVRVRGRPASLVLGHEAAPSRAARATGRRSACRRSRPRRSRRRSGRWSPGRRCDRTRVPCSPAPRRPARGPCRRPSTTSRCDTMPRSEPANEVRTSRCCCGGNRSRMRLIVSMQSIVCRVEITRWPVSAAWIADIAESPSRISPTKITSGSWRITCRSAFAYESVSMPISRCCTIESTSSCITSIGSSIVTMCARRRAVDVPDHRCDRRRLAGAGRPGDEHEAARRVGERRHDPGQCGAPRTSAPRCAHAGSRAPPRRADGTRSRGSARRPASVYPRSASLVSANSRFL